MIISFSAELTAGRCLYYSYWQLGELADSHSSSLSLALPGVVQVSTHQGQRSVWNSLPCPHWLHNVPHRCQFRIST